MLPLNSVVLNVQTLPSDVSDEFNKQNIKLTSSSFLQNASTSFEFLANKVSLKGESLFIIFFLMIFKTLPFLFA